MTIKFIIKEEPDGLVRLSSLCSGSAFWSQDELFILSDEIDNCCDGEPYLCLRLTDGVVVRLNGDELVLPTTLEVREV